MLKIIGFICIIYCIPLIHCDDEDILDTDIFDFFNDIPTVFLDALDYMDDNETELAYGNPCLRDFRNIFKAMRAKKMWAFRGKAILMT